jgi:hypothetical protein
MDLSYDQLISQLIDAKIEGEGATWKQAAIAYFLRVKLQAPAKAIASDTGYSSKYVTNMVKTFETFPEETDRVLDLSYSHHQEAAMSDNPAHWIVEASDNAWSVRELKRAINGESPQKSEQEIAENLLAKVTAFLDSAGDAADWLIVQLTDLL